jgi:hypothetical protein
MALIKHHLIFQNVFAYNISNDNNDNENIIYFGKQFYRQILYYNTMI